MDMHMGPKLKSQMYQDLELSYDAACATYQYRAKCCRRAYPATAVLYCY